MRSQTTHAYVMTGNPYPVYSFSLTLVVDLKEMLRLRNHTDFRELVRLRLQFSFRERSFEIRTARSFWTLTSLTATSFIFTTGCFLKCIRIHLSSWRFILFATHQLCKLIRLHIMWWYQLIMCLTVCGHRHIRSIHFHLQQWGVHLRRLKRVENPVGTLVGPR